VPGVCRFHRQRQLPVRYKETVIDSGYRVDLLIEDRLIVEVKSVTDLDPVHAAQLLTYLRLSGCPVGLLINFNVRLLKQGIRRFVLNFP
jgi:GxxExxY protein